MSCVNSGRTRIQFMQRIIKDKEKKSYKDL